VRDFGLSPTAGRVARPVHIVRAVLGDDRKTILGT
jgi:hypothetical protein